MNARASRTAISVASVPEDVNRTRSAEGTRRRIAAAQRTSPAGWRRNVCRAASASATALRHRRMVVPQQQRAMAAEVIDVFVAVDVPFARTGGAVDINPVWLDMPRIMRNAARADSPPLRVASAAEPACAARYAATMRELVSSWSIGFNAP